MRTSGLVVTAALVLGSASAGAQNSAEHPQHPAPPHEQQAPAIEARLKNFDVLDFDVFSKHKRDSLA